MPSASTSNRSRKPAATALSSSCWRGGGALVALAAVEEYAAERFALVLPLVEADAVRLERQGPRRLIRPAAGQLRPVGTGARNPGPTSGLLAAAQIRYTRGRSAIGRCSKATMPTLSGSGQR